MSDQCLLILTVPPAVEAVLTDLLLERMPDLGFTAVPAFGHGTSEAAMSVMDRIAGRVRRVQFEILCRDEGMAAQILALIKVDFSDAGIHYWMLPVLTSGRLGMKEA